MSSAVQDIPDGEKKVGLGALCRSKPLWICVVATWLQVGPFMMALSIIVAWTKDLPEAFLVTNAFSAIQALIDAWGTAFITWLSEPCRLGRKKAYLLLSCFVTLFFSSLVFSGGGLRGAWVWLGGRVVFSFIGAANPQGAPFTIMMATMADNLPETLHAQAFSLLLAAQSSTFVIFPVLAMVANSFGGESAVLYAALGIMLLQLPFILFFFPSGQLQAAPIDNAGNREEVPQAPPGSRMSAVRDIAKALGWIFRERTAVTICWMAVMLVCAADSTNIMLFLSDGRNFSNDQVNMVLASMGLAGMIISLLVVPFVAGCLSKGLIVLLGVFGTCGHVLIYAFVADPTTVALTSFLGAMNFACMPTLISYMPRENSTGLGQGVLIGAFQSIKSVCTVVGPPLLACCVQSYLDGDIMCYVIPGIRNFVGSGFVILAFCMIPAMFASVTLVLREGLCLSPVSRSNDARLLASDAQR